MLGESTHNVGAKMLDDDIVDNDVGLQSLERFISG